ncbi:branched-chain amino acid aminotransferase [Dactylosporangium matsuzakiense]|uniref:Branched-chain-amino-acid aminotransferase n=1 Tax=Dactylosporangium matsuzakiense TaxID=53360 RepID=A0A9W6NME5_9ACTN|nr:branched-chain amino acid aminotransferase [Dactylosporangium matsuzakiense]UWZ44459.1 branched-chain amino acid aminotransferase [Dactylosporangium matsuzakiense]GLL01842.1 branched-chain-amino-acid aminotransferase [Dactylosporangium matsuzakiense]
MLEFDIVPARRRPAEERAALLADPGFGRVFTDHMITIKFGEDGWHDARLIPFGPLSLSPATAALHYSQELFEGLKAYALPNGEIGLFRPEANARRLNATAERLAMPALPEELFLKAVWTLVEADRDWVPSGEGQSLYIRPFMIATDPFLGVRPSSEYLFAVIASPSGAYFSGGAKPVTVWISQDYSRAAPGGTGHVKAAANYAVSLRAQAQAQDAGCDQTVFLDAVEQRWIEESGSMNLFFVYENSHLVTPPLNGSILPGVTRDSVIRLARHNGWTVEERPYSVDEWRADAESGALRETFACGTGVVITAIGRARSRDGEFTIAGAAEGPVTASIRDTLVGIQRGRLEDPFGWSVRRP